MFVGVLCHNDPVVHDNTDGKRDSSQGHDVGCDSKCIQQDKACSNGDRDLDDDAYCASPVKKKNDYDQRHNNHFFYKRGLN